MTPRGVKAMKSRIFKSVLLAASLCMAVSTASAVPIVFFGEDLSPGGTVPAGGAAETARNSFLAMLSGVGNEDFESFANLTSIGGPGINVSFPGSGGAITANLTGANGGICDQTIGGAVNGITCGFQRFATSGNNYLQNGSNMVLTFTSAISAFGFYGTDFGDFDQEITLTLSNGDVQVFVIPSTKGAAAGGNVLFWGMIDPTNSYTSIAFSTTGSTDIFGFDDLVIGDQDQIVGVPEPGTLALLGIGLFGMGLARRRKTA